MARGHVVNAPMPAAVQRYTLAEIAEALGRVKSSVAARAEKESWSFDAVAVRGGKKRLYPVSGLPADVRRAIAEKHLISSPLVAVPSLAAAIGAASLPAPLVPASVPAPAGALFRGDLTLSLIHI